MTAFSSLSVECCTRYPSLPHWYPPPSKPANGTLQQYAPKFKLSWLRRMSAVSASNSVEGQQHLVFSHASHTLPVSSWGQVKYFSLTHMNLHALFSAFPLTSCAALTSTSHLYAQTTRASFSFSRETSKLLPAPGLHRPGHRTLSMPGPLLPATPPPTQSSGPTPFACDHPRRLPPNQALHGMLLSYPLHILQKMEDLLKFVTIDKLLHCLYGIPFNI